MHLRSNLVWPGFVLIPAIFFAFFRKFNFEVSGSIDKIILVYHLLLTGLRSQNS